MAEHVEGDWKNFTFKMALPEDYPKILEHLRLNFYQDEPQNKYMGQDEDRLKDMDAVGIKFLKQGLSFYVYDRNNNNKVVGARVTGISREGDDADLLTSEMHSKETEDFLPNIIELIEEANTFEKLGVDQYGDFLFVSVDREYRGQGLAGEMYKRAINLLKSKGILVAESIFSNPISQHIARSLGFQELSRKYLKDYKRLDGSVMFPQAKNEDVAIVMAKIL